MMFRILKPREIWNEENKHCLNYLLTNAKECLPILSRVVYNFEWDRLYFNYKDKDSRIEGCTLIDFSSLSQIRITHSGDFNSLIYLLRNLEKEKEVVFNFIKERDVENFSSTLNKSPELNIFYQELNPTNNGDLHDDELPRTTKEVKLVIPFKGLRTSSIIDFYSFPYSKKNSDLFSKVNGMCIVSRNGEIIGSVYDSLSLFPIQIKIALISGVLIKKSKRNLGLCPFILKKFIEYLYKSNKKVISLLVNTYNKKAIKCYNKTGFEIKEKYYNLIIEKRELKNMMPD
ncbi:MAG: GNAT family N-acetyltransferase [Promethearchaeota archaeon]